MPTQQIVFDIETQRTFDEVGGRNIKDLGVSVVGVYFYETNEYRTFEESQIGELEQIFSSVSRLVGFNTHRFDFIVLQPYLKRLKLADLPSLDLLEELEKILGHRISLQSLASATLNEGKSGSGLDAIRYYRSGDMEKLKKYCLDDVRLTKELYEFGKNSGYLYYFAKDGSTKLRVNVHWADPTPAANLSLF